MSSTAPEPAGGRQVTAALDDQLCFDLYAASRAVTGRYRGQLVTVAAFGMGAPIAGVVLHDDAAVLE